MVRKIDGSINSTVLRNQPRAKKKKIEQLNTIKTQFTELFFSVNKIKYNWRKHCLAKEKATTKKTDEQLKRPL